MDRIRFEVNHVIGKLSIALTVCAGLTVAQSAAAPSMDSRAKSPHFEVVSIRPAKPESKPSFGPTPDGFRMVNHPLIGLFQIAYVPTADGDSGFFRASRISGAPDWLSRSELFDVAAKVSDADLAEWQKPELQSTMLRAMMRALVEERLKAVVHIENRELPVYSLVVAKGGAKLKPAEILDLAELRAKHPGSIPLPGGGIVTLGGGAKQVNFWGVSVVALTPFLSSLAGRPVEDNAGLAGRYDFSIPMSLNSLGVAIEEAMAKPGAFVNTMGPPPPPPPLAGSADGSDAPPSTGSETSIFTAVQEQLGLRLEPAKGRVETLVIDHVEKPTAN